MQSNTAFNLSQSGQPFTLANGLLNSSSLTVSYVPTNLSQSYAVTIMGVTNASGESTVLDSFSGVGISGQRSVSLSSVTFDSFVFVPSFTGANQQFSIGASVTSMGAGAVFDAETDLPNVYSRTS